MDESIETALVTDDITALLQDSGLDLDCQANASLIAAAFAVRRAGISHLVAVAMLSQFYGRIDALN